MHLYIILATAIGLAVPAYASERTVTAPASPDAPEQHVQIIVKACYAAETPLQPTNQGKIYDNEKSPTLAERKDMLAKLGCIDVPIPMEWLSWPMTAAGCAGHAGYLASMQFLQQRQDLAEYPAVGAWECLVTPHEVAGIMNQ
jgi:hypothetical protein